MFKKFILPIAIASAVVLSACAGSKNENAEPAQEAPQAKIENEIVTTDAIPTDSVVAYDSDTHITNTCTIDEETENSLQITIENKDTVTINKISLKDNIIGMYTTIKFKGNFSDESFLKECKKAKGLERANNKVFCKDRTIYVSKETEGEDKEAILFLPLFMENLKDACLTIQKTGSMPNE